MYRMTDEEFESAIVEALDAMPEQFLEALQNVAVVWEEEPVTVIQSFLWAS